MGDRIFQPQEAATFACSWKFSFLVSSCHLQPPDPSRMGLHPATGDSSARLGWPWTSLSRGPMSRTAWRQGRPRPSCWWSLGSGMDPLAADDWAGEPSSTEQHFRRKIDPSLRSRLTPWRGVGTERSETAKAFATEKFQISLISLLERLPLSLFK